ncbi:MAG: hypothetical protein WCI22_12955, partial [Actinomycetota bacterium]
LTDSNRDRAHHWRSSQDVTGFTERGTASSDVVHPDEADQRLPVFGLTPNPLDQTIATLDGGLQVSASGYGEPFAYRPEQRPAMAVDGDPSTAWVVGDRTDPIGEFITVSNASGYLTLLQATNSNAATRPNRMITHVHLQSGDGRGADVALGPHSLTGDGQRVAVPGKGSLSITITAVATRPGGNDSGPSAVGFAELGLGRHVEIVRTPRLPTGVTSTTPLDVVLTRLRVDPMNRWRSDPEPTLVRQFTTVGARRFETTITLTGDHRASDSVANQIDFTKGAVASERLTGDLKSRGFYATDGDPATAWTSPFGSTKGITLTVPLDGTAVSTLRLQQPVDALHSLITNVRVDVDGAKVDLKVGSPDTQGVSVLHLPTPLVGHTLTLTITGVKAHTTTDRRFAETTVLPVSIRELASPAIVASTRLPGDLAPFCSKGFVSIDGAPIATSMTQVDVQTLADGGTVKVHPCGDGTVELATGTHRLESVDGVRTGIDVDRVVLTSHPGGISALAPAPQVAVRRTLTTRTATVAACPTGCWLIFGEGLNAGWTAATHGQSLGAPQQVSGGFNGWWLPPNDASTVVDISWTVQRSIDWALIASAMFVLLCLVLVVKVRRPATGGVDEWVSSPPVFSRAVWSTQSWTRSIVAGAALVAITALIAGPSTALYALVPAAVIVAQRRPRLAGVFGALLMAALGARVLQRQSAGRFLANAAWPGLFDRLHRPGMLVVAMVLVAALADRYGDVDR